MRSKALQLNSNPKKILFLCVGALFVALVFLYTYFLYVGILYAVERKHMEKDLAALRTGISETESSYLASASGLTLSHAYERGFKDAENIVYVKKDTLLLSGITKRDVQ